MRNITLATRTSLNAYQNMLRLFRYLFICQMNRSCCGVTLLNWTMTLWHWCHLCGVMSSDCHLQRGFQRGHFAWTILWMAARNILVNHILHTWPIRNLNIALLRCLNYDAMSLIQMQWHWLQHNDIDPGVIALILIVWHWSCEVMALTLLT